MATFGHGFYQDQTTALTASFVAVNFSTYADTLVICNDETVAGKTVIISLDGVTTHMVLVPGDRFVLKDTRLTGLYVKYGTGAPSYRIMAMLSSR